CLRSATSSTRTPTSWREIGDAQIFVGAVASRCLGPVAGEATVRAWEPSPQTDPLPGAVHRLASIDRAPGHCPHADPALIDPARGTGHLRRGSRADHSAEAGPAWGAALLAALEVEACEAASEVGACEAVDGGGGRGGGRRSDIALKHDIHLLGRL